VNVFKMTLARNNVAPCGYLRIETCRSDFKCFIVKFYVNALVGVIIKVGLHIWYPIVRHYKKMDESTSLSSFIYSVQSSASNTYLALLCVV